MNKYFRICSICQINHYPHSDVLVKIFCKFLSDVSIGKCYPSFFLIKCKADMLYHQRMIKTEFLDST